jgi:hypothetical protein
MFLLMRISDAAGWNPTEIALAVYDDHKLASRHMREAQTDANRIEREEERHDRRQSKLPATQRVRFDRPDRLRHDTWFSVTKGRVNYSVLTVPFVSGEVLKATG